MYFLQEPGLFESDVVMAQLRYSGVLETVRIRKEGFPVRLPFQQFIDRYLHRWFLASTDPYSAILPEPQEYNPGRTGFTVHCTYRTTTCSWRAADMIVILQYSILTLSENRC